MLMSNQQRYLKSILFSAVFSFTVLQRFCGGKWFCFLLFFNSWRCLLTDVAAISKLLNCRVILNKKLNQTHIFCATILVKWVKQAHETSNSKILPKHNSFLSPKTALIQISTHEVLFNNKLKLKALTVGGSISSARTTRGVLHRSYNLFFLGSTNFF